MPTLDIFSSSPAFSLMELTVAINKVPFVPGQVGKLGIFNEQGIYTTAFEVEELAGQLYLIPNTVRGAPAPQNTRDKRVTRYFKNMHLPVRDRIMADEIQNKRAFGTENELATAISEVNARQAKMSKSLDATLEYGRVNALKGTILDSDGTTVIYNLFTEFNVTQVTEDFDLGNATSDLLGHCTTVRENMQTELGGDGGDDIEVVALVGKTWFKRFISHPKVAPAYQYYQSVAANLNPLQHDLRYKGFTFGDITFMVYRGTVSGVGFIADSEGYAFPTNVPGLFQTAFAPADYMETVNTKGQPRYSKMVPDPSGYNKFVEIEAQSNPLSYCTRPKVCNKLTTGS